MLSKKPRSATSFRIVSQLKQAGWDFKTIIDGGANLGQFSRACANGFPNARVIAFEPLPEVSEQLKVNLSDHANHEVQNCALGNEDGEIEFNQTDDTQCSSVLSVSESADWMPNSINTRILKVPLQKLDTIFSDAELASPVLLKLDLQGYELEAIKGAVDLLAKVDCILLEAVFDEVYVGEPSLNEIWRHLNQQGFVISGILNTMTDASGKIVQVDALFVKADVSEEETGSVSEIPSNLAPSE